MELKFILLFFLLSLPGLHAQEAGTDNPVLSEIFEKTEALKNTDKEGLKEYLRRTLDLGKNENNQDVIYYTAETLANLCKDDYDLEGLNKYCEICISAAEELGENPKKCRFLLAWGHTVTQDLDAAESRLNILLKEEEETKDTVFIIKILENLAKTVQLRNDLEKSVELRLQAIDLAKAFPDTTALVLSCMNLSTSFYYVNDMERAKYYLDLADSYYRPQDLRINLRLRLNRLTHMDDLVAIGKELDEIIELSEGSQDYAVLSTACLNYADILMDEERYSEAILYLEKGVDKAVDEEMLFVYYLRFSDAYLLMGNCRSGAEYLKKIQNFSSLPLHNFYKQKYYKLKVDSKVCSGEIKSLQSDIDSFLVYQDSLILEERAAEAMLVETEYRNRIQSDSISILSLKVANQDYELRQRGIYFVGTIIIIPLLLLLMFQFRRRYRMQTRLNEVLKQNSEKRIKLFANIAHEFQTPLTLISGFSNRLLKSENGSPETKKAACHIYKSSTQLSDAVRDILTLSQEAPDDQRQEEKTIEVHNFFNYLKESYHEIAEFKLINLEFQAEDKKATLVSDPHLLKVVLENLISNALKFTPQGGNVKVEYQTGANSHRLKVTDSGKGINDTDLPHIFNRFFQVDTEKAEGGLGIGLSICKEYISALGGDIRVQSVLGVGTTFIIDLPKKSSDAPVYEYSSFQLDRSELNESPVTEQDKYSLLVVEDNLDVCAYLKTVLEEDYELSFVHDGLEALNKLERHSFDIIITDEMMPQMSGNELVEILKSKSETKSIPVLMLTAKSLHTDYLHSLRVGVNDYLRKPFEEEELKSRLSALLTLSEVDNIAGETESSISLASKLPEQDELDSLRSEQWLMQLDRHIKENIKDFNLNTDLVAAKMGISSTILKLRVKELTGMTIGNYIREIRFWEARKLLETKAISSVKAVSYTVGFKDTKYFSRKFKERFGKYPSAYL